MGAAAAGPPTPPHPGLGLCRGSCGMGGLDEQLGRQGREVVGASWGTCGCRGSAPSSWPHSESVLPGAQPAPASNWDFLPGASDCGPFPVRGMMGESPQPCSPGTWPWTTSVGSLVGVMWGDILAGMGAPGSVPSPLARWGGLGEGPPMSTQQVPPAMASSSVLAGAVGKHSWDVGGSLAWPHPAKDPAGAVPVLCQSGSQSRTWLCSQWALIPPTLCYPAPCFPRSGAGLPHAGGPRSAGGSVSAPCPIVPPPGAPPLALPCLLQAAWALPALVCLQCLAQPLAEGLCLMPPKSASGEVRNHPAPGRAGMSALGIITALLRAGVWQRVQAGSLHGAALPRLGQIFFRALLAGTADCRLAASPRSEARVPSTSVGSQHLWHPRRALGCCCMGPMGWEGVQGGCVGFS